MRHSPLSHKGRGAGGEGYLAPTSKYNGGHEGRRCLGGYLMFVCNRPGSVRSRPARGEIAMLARAG